MEAALALSHLCPHQGDSWGSAAELVGGYVIPWQTTEPNPRRYLPKGIFFSGVLSLLWDICTTGSSLKMLVSTVSQYLNG